MRTIIKSLIVVSAIATSGAAFAGEVGDTTADQNTVASQLAFVAQSSNRATVQTKAMQRDTVVVQAPLDVRQTIVDTQESARGANN